MRRSAPSRRPRRVAKQTIHAPAVRNIARNADLVIASEHLVRITHPFHQFGEQQLGCMGERYNWSGAGTHFQTSCIQKVGPHFEVLLRDTEVGCNGRLMLGPRRSYTGAATNSPNASPHGIVISSSPRIRQPPEKHLSPGALRRR